MKAEDMKERRLYTYTRKVRGGTVKKGKGPLVQIYETARGLKMAIIDCEVEGKAVTVWPSQCQAVS